ncbi:MAG: protein-L-isoaspartate(D-aspartate) O-methyltransferase [Candidatus Aminicenantes bacterium]|nr:protein-L-isoaspartate(D-aspartate) O-methyltransferase [Candidatus Aminicenantes bacterium]
MLIAQQNDFLLQRKNMLENQILARGITEKNILNAFMKVKRHLFVSPGLKDKAYEDFPLAIGEGQTINEPYIVAIITYAISPDKNKKVMEIGTGSGYHAAILAELVKEVYTIEIKETLAQEAIKRLNSLKYNNIKFKIGDGYHGWPKHAPFDGIIMTSAIDHIPEPLVEQLAVGGRMVIPVSYSSEVQELIIIEKQMNGQLKRINLNPVQFVPLIRSKDEK